MDTFNAMKQGLAYILNVDESEIVLLLKSKVATVYVTATDPTDPTRPATDGSPKSILSLIQNNQTWIKAYIKPECSSVVGTECVSGTNECAEPSKSDADAKSAACYNASQDTPKAFMAAISPCAQAYCQCLGYTAGVEKCSIPYSARGLLGVAGDRWVKCHQANAKCQIKAAGVVVNAVAACQPWYDNLMTSYTMSACRSNACKLDDAIILNDVQLYSLCVTNTNYFKTLPARTLPAPELGQAGPGWASLGRPEPGILSVKNLCCTFFVKFNLKRKNMPPRAGHTVFPSCGVSSRTVSFMSNKMNVSMELMYASLQLLHTDARESTVAA